MTTITTQTGDDTVFISSEANQNIDNARTVDVLLGWLDYVEENLTVNVDTGRHRLLMSDEKSLIAKGQSSPARLTNRSLTNLHNDLGDIFFDTTGSGNWSAGVDLWLSKGNDRLEVQSVPANAGSALFRTTTCVHAGDGNDTLVISLDTEEHDGVVFVANGQAGDDTINASLSTHPVILFGERGDDILVGGHGNDVILGDLGRVIWKEAVVTPAGEPARRLNNIFQRHHGTAHTEGDIVAQVGGGGYGDFTDGIIRTVSEVISLYTEVGGMDEIDTGNGDNVAIGGFDDDAIQGGSDRDILVRLAS
jgi:Ca2+-binding RTX toxin-like protein